VRVDLEPETVELLAVYARPIGWEGDLRELANRALHARLTESIPLAVRIANARRVYEQNAGAPAASHG